MYQDKRKAALAALLAVAIVAVGCGTEPVSSSSVPQTVASASPSSASASSSTPSSVSYSSSATQFPESAPDVPALMEEPPKTPAAAPPATEEGPQWTKVRVLDKAGQPVATATLRLETVPEGYPSQWVTNAQGYAQLVYQLGWGEPDLFVYGKETVFAVSVYDAVAGKTHTQQLSATFTKEKMKSETVLQLTDFDALASEAIAPTVILQITNKDGAPMEDILVAALPRDTPADPDGRYSYTAQVYTDKEGLARFYNLPAGRYRFTMTAQGSYVYETALDVTDAVGQLHKITP